VEPSVRRPARVLRLDAAIEPLAAIVALRRRGAVVALETTRPSTDHGTQTIVAGDPLAAFTWQHGAASVEVLRAEGRSLRDVPLADAPTPFHALERLVAAADLPRLGADPDAAPDGANGFSECSVAPPFGAFGYFGYECAMAPELPRLAPFPDAWFLICDTVVHWEHAGAQPRLVAAGATDERPADRLEPLARSIEMSRDEAARLDDGATCADAPADPRDFSWGEYEDAFAAARRSLASGDSYQLCFTYPLLRPWREDPLRLYARLRRFNPAPFAAYVEAPFGAIASSSPERFLQVDRAGRVQARPMKGTAARADDREERTRAARELVESEKTRAENLMIADLLRNDLGRVCELGSVRAVQPALLEEHGSVLQLVSVLEGRLARGRTCADLLASAFPPGSMTGAPKARSIELLRALERAPRGPYSGALGYLTADGRMDLSVVIRAALLASGVARVNVGGGIVWDSEARGEFEESRMKAAPLLRALAAEACAGAARASS
jgi:anthranilate/para-aminobenzoate synthase component I